MDPHLEESTSRKRSCPHKDVYGSEDDFSDTRPAIRSSIDDVHIHHDPGTNNALFNNQPSSYPSVPAGALLMGHLIDRTETFAGMLQLTSPTLVAIERVRSTKHLLQSQGLEILREHPDGVKFGFIYNYTPEYVFFLEKPSALMQNVVFGPHAFVADYEELLKHPNSRIRGLFLYEYTHDLDPEKSCIAIFFWNGDCDPEKALRDWLAKWEIQLKSRNLVQMG